MSEFDDVEARLRSALTDEAHSINPTDRWLQIQVGTGAAPAQRRPWASRHATGRAPRAGMPRWLLPVAASLVAALVGVGVWAAGQRPGTDPSAAAAAAVATIGDIPTATSGPTPLVANGWAAPLYYPVEVRADGDWSLQRDFVPAVLTDPSVTGRVTAAVTTLVSGQLTTGAPLPAYAGLRRAWLPGTTATAAVSTDEIRVVLNQPGLPGLTEDQERVAVQAIVWTATGAAQATVPVHVSAAGGRSVFASQPPTRYRRPAAALEDLASIWITDPLRWTPVSSRSPVTVSGQACTLDPTLVWELRQGTGAIVASGRVTATSACPSRGTWSADLGRLSPGDYRLRVFSTSPKDGLILSEAETPFSVG